MGLKSFSLRVFNCGILFVVPWMSGVDIVHCLRGYVVKPGFNCGVSSLNLFKPKESFL